MRAAACAPSTSTRAPTRRHRATTSASGLSQPVTFETCATATSRVRDESAAASCPRSSSPAAVSETQPNANFGVVTVGSCDLAVREALAELARNGIRGDYMRIRGFPFGPEVDSFLRSHDRMFVVEQNRDAQLRALLTLETGVHKHQLYSVLSYGGMPLQADQVVSSIVHQIRGTGRTDPTAVKARTAD